MAMAMVTAAVIGYGNGNSSGNRDGDGNSEGDGDCNGKGPVNSNNDKGRVASSFAKNVQRCGRGNTLPLPPWTQRKVIHQCCVMGVKLLRVFAPVQGGGFLTAHHRMFFVYFLQLLLFLLNNPLFAPRIIQALKNPVSPLMLYLLHSSKNPVSLQCSCG
jgi:hypothetical protein